MRVSEPMSAAVAAAAATSAPSSSRSARRPLSIEGDRNSITVANRSSAPTHMSAAPAPGAANAATVTAIAPKPVPSMSGMPMCRSATWVIAA